MIQTCLVYFKRTILLYVVLGFLVQFCSAYGITLFQQLLDNVAAARGFNAALPLVMLYGAMLAVTTIVNYLILYPQTYLSAGIMEKLKLLAFGKVSRIDYAAYQNIGTGEMIKVIENGAAAGTQIIHAFYLRILQELLPTVLFSLLFISRYSPTVMLIIGAGYAVIFGMNHVLLRVLYRFKSALLESQEKMSAQSVRGFMELVVFRLNKRYRKEMERMQRTAEDIVSKSTQIRMIHESFFAVFALLVNGIKIVVLVYGIKRILEGDTSIGAIVALLLFIEHVYSPIAIFNVLFVDYKLNRVAFARLERFANAPEDMNLETGREVGELKGDLAFEHVTFGYGGTEVLRNVSFAVKRGSSVAIVGLSGSGKSTLIKLMLGLLKKQSGSIRWDGSDIDELKLNSLYDHVSYISQEAPIFADSIRGNIDFDRELPDELIYDILTLVRMKEEVLRMPDRLDALVGEKGMKLSGGERQRLAFARIIAQRRNVVILDEPVSGLDNITEKTIMDEVLRLFRGRTLVIVAHRLHAIANVDTILLVKDGEVVGEGSFAELIQTSGYFQALWQQDSRNGAR